MDPIFPRAPRERNDSSEDPVLINGLHMHLELRPLQSQVAGHSAATGKSSLDITCIALQNVTEGMLEPCVMDVKIGKQTWEPSASDEKKKIEKAKYVESKRECGFCIPGMQFYDIDSHELFKYGKEYGKHLDRNGIKNALKLFLNWSSSISHPLILLFLCKLWKMLRWFKSQRQYLFYSSSLLFVYDAHLLRQCTYPEAAYSRTISNNSSSQTLGLNEFLRGIESLQLPGDDAEQDCKELENICLKNYDQLLKCFSKEGGEYANRFADVKMIDFAHTLIACKCSIDSNYIEGLQNLVTIFEILLKESC